VWDTVGTLGIPTADAACLRPAVDRFNRRWAFHDTELSSWIAAAVQALAIDEERSDFRPALWHQQRGAAEQGQELKQVWFAGVHCDVGGGYQETGLSDIPWCGWPARPTDTGCVSVPVSSVRAGPGR
jgi:hypothetical protein